MALVLALIRTQAQTVEPFGLDLHGHPIRQLAGPGIHAVVLIFAASDCPISNRYVPEVRRLSQEFSARGVRFWWVYPNAGDTAEVVQNHIRDYSIQGDIALDPKQALVALAHATVTPEAAVLVASGGKLRLAYHGRIDDRYIPLGRERPQPEHHDLEAAIIAALGGKPVPQPAGPPVGCSIVFLRK